MQVEIVGIDSGKPIYSAFTQPFSVAAAATDVFIMEGFTGSNIRILRFHLSTLQTAAGINTWFLNKHSTANTGGTAVSTAKIPHTAGHNASGALVQHYTANPTVGTSLGSVFTFRLNSPTVTTAGTGDLQGIVFDFVSTLGMPIVLNGPQQGLALNLNGATVAGLSVVAGFTWTEG